MTGVCEMGVRGRPWGVAAVAGVIAAAALGGVGAVEDASVVGSWVAPFSEDGDGDGSGDFDAAAPADAEESGRLPTAVNAAVLPDGRVLYWSQLDGTEQVPYSIAFQAPVGARSRTRVLDLGPQLSGAEYPPPPSAWTVPSPEHGAGGDFVGSAQVALPDGRILALGGTEWSNEDAELGLPEGVGRTELYGIPDARIFDPARDTWTRAQDMDHGRYYPAPVTLPDGRVLTSGGVGRLVYDSSFAPGPRPPEHAVPRGVRASEVLDAGDGSWDTTVADGPPLPPLPHVHVLPNGRVFHPAAGMLYPPGGGDGEAAAWNMQRWYDPIAGSWSEAGEAPFGVRSNAYSVLLPLEPPYRRAEVLVGGGTFGGWPGGYVGTAVTERITWDADASDPDRPVRALDAPMTTPRWHATAVVAPTGEVVVLSGADRDEVIDPGSGIAVRRAEMRDPATGRWTALASGARDRTLHNTAVLLRDGSILVGGHSPVPAHYGGHRQNPPPFASNFKDPSFEVFRPPYLYRGPRPVITSVDGATVARGGGIGITTPAAGDASLRVVLSRLPAITHVVDADQRTVVLAHQVEGDGRIRAAVPASAAVVPPGHYYVFLVTDDGQGPTPSVAEIVRIT